MRALHPIIFLFVCLFGIACAGDSFWWGMQATPANIKQLPFIVEYNITGSNVNFIVTARIEDGEGMSFEGASLDCVATNCMKEFAGSTLLLLGHGQIIEGRTRFSFAMATNYLTSTYCTLQYANVNSIHVNGAVYYFCLKDFVNAK